MRKEDYLIWQLVVGGRDIPGRDRISLFLREELDWQYFIDSAGKERVSSLIYNRIKEEGWEHLLPEQVFNRLQAVYYAHSRYNTLIYEEFILAASALKKEGICFVPLKGIFLAQNLYGNAALRPMTDIDLLVKKGEVNNCIRALGVLGYKIILEQERELANPYAYSITLIKEKGGELGGFSIDLHWHILNSSWMMGLFAGKIALGAIWQETQPITIDGIDTLALSSEYLVINLCLNFFNQGFSRLIMLSDIAMVLEKYGNKDLLEKVKTLAESLGFSNVLDIVLALAQARDDLGFQRWQSLKKFNSYCFPALLFMATVRGISGKLKALTGVIKVAIYLVCRRFGGKEKLGGY